MPLDSHSLAVVEVARAGRARGPALLLEVMRAHKPRVPTREVLDLVARTEDLTIAGPAGPIRVRLYWPKQADPAGVTLYFHGGGFVLGSIEAVDGAARVLCAQSHCLVASVEYRLAPEHKFPAGAEDAFASLQWARLTALEMGGLKVAVAGESAGGTLATVACMMARDRRAAQADFQLLICPGINLALHTPERDALADEDYVLSRDLIDWLNAYYCETPDDFRHPYCAPAYASLGGLPTALVVAAEYDPLRFENEAYAARLQAAGVPCVFRLYEGTIHGFVNAFEHIPIGRRALEHCGAALLAALSC